MDKPTIGPGKDETCVGRTTSIEEAEELARRYELQGFETWIIRKSQGGIALYEVWASKEPHILGADEDGCLCGK
jgi:hypothetical protein